MKPEAALVVAGGVLLVGVRRDQRRVGKGREHGGQPIPGEGEV